MGGKCGWSTLKVKGVQNKQQGKVWLHCWSSNKYFVNVCFDYYYYVFLKKKGWISSKCSWLFKILDVSVRQYLLAECRYSQSAKYCQTIRNHLQLAATFMIYNGRYVKLYQHFLEIYLAKIVLNYFHCEHQQTNIQFAI